MGIKTIDRSLFVQMVRNGLRNLTINKDLINKLNVFPVPDGDTGTNMHLSLTSGVKEVEQVKDESIQKIVASFSRGLLMGARGNSGVFVIRLHLSTWELRCNLITDFPWLCGSFRKCR